VFGPDASVPGTGNDPRSAVSIANGILYVSGYTDDTTYAFDAATGTRLWSAPLGDIGLVGPVVVNGRLYVGEYGGTIHAYAP
jgi:outer membrane protein assembly factor BamB